MMTAQENLLQPNRLKIVLALTILFPVLIILVVFLSFLDSEPLIVVILALVVSYMVACIIDTVIESRTAKIAIASVAALVSIVLGYIIVRSMTMVCDPVHDPGIVCDPVHVPDTTPEPAVIATIQPTPTTPMICDPVHEPGAGGTGAPGIVPGVATGIVAQKLAECKKKCGR